MLLLAKARSGCFLGVCSSQAPSNNITNIAIICIITVSMSMSSRVRFLYYSSRILELEGLGGCGGVLGGASGRPRSIVTRVEGLRVLNRLGV